MWERLYHRVHNNGNDNVWSLSQSFYKRGMREIKTATRTLFREHSLFVERRDVFAVPIQGDFFTVKSHYRKFLVSYSQTEYFSENFVEYKI